MAYERTGGRRLYVGKLPSDANRDDLEKLFFRIGDLVDVRVLQGFAFVEFERLRVSCTGVCMPRSAAECLHAGRA